MSITKAPFGLTSEGEQAHLYQITNSAGASVTLTDFGATLVSVRVPDKKGTLVDVILGYDTIGGYIANHCYFGATIGRNGNRIENARFTLGGREYLLEKNKGEHNLHSGFTGYNAMLWPVKEAEKDRITFARLSPHGEQGFPGNLEISVTFLFTEENEICIRYRGRSDQDTVVNLTNHAYFNLSGEDSGPVYDQELQILADTFLPFGNSDSIPTGEFRSVEGTPMDFRRRKPIGQDIGKEDEQLAFAGGYDHNFVLRDYRPGMVRKVAEAYSPATGICLEVETDLPGVQLYTGNFVDHVPGKGGRFYEKRSAFCLETQHFPNGINRPGEEPNAILKAGEFYDTQTRYRFFVQ